MLFGVNWRATHAAANEALRAMGLGHLDSREPLASLSIAMQQLVAISRAMVIDAKVLILDEPTSSLDALEVENLFHVLRSLRDKGVAILFVSHFLDQVYAISDRITVLRNGAYVGEYLTRELDRQKLISLMIGKELAVFASISRAATSLESAGATEVLLEATGLGRKGKVAPTDLVVNKGEVLGFAGLLGSGRTELARLLYGADKPDTGDVTMHGKHVSLHSPVSGLNNRIAFSTENRRDEGTVGDLTVRENLVLAVQARRGWSRPLSKRERDAIVDKYISELGVRPADPDRPIKDLSGGNQQKVLLGRWLATGPELPHPRRADARYRRRGEGGDPGGSGAASRRWDFGGLHLIRARGSGQAQQPGGRDEGPSQDRRDHRRPGCDDADDRRHHRR